MSIHIDASEFLADLEALKNDIHAGLRVAWEQASEETLEVMRGHGYKDRTGNLSRTMYSQVFVNGMFNISADVVAPASYALYVDQPTKAHPIFPKGADGSPGLYQDPGLGKKRGVQRRRNMFTPDRKALRWFENGRPVFAKYLIGSHQHPGTFGAFFSEAAANHGWRFSELSQQQIDAAIARHA